MTPTRRGFSPAHAQAMLAVWALLPWTALLGGLQKLPSTQDPDALNLMGFAASLHDAVLRFGELPLWNPFLGGGVPWIGHPLNPGVSPASLVYIACGEVVGVKVWLAIVLLLGTLGMFQAARLYGRLDALSAWFTAAAYSSAMWMAGRMQSGNYCELSYFAWPLLLVALDWLARGRWLGLLLPLGHAALLAQGRYFSGMVYVVGLLLLPLHIEARQIGRLRLAALWTAGFGFGLLLSMPKLLPLFDLMARDRVDQLRYGLAISYEGFHDLLGWLLLHDLLNDRAPHHAIGVGLGVLGLSLLGAVLRPKQSALGLGVLMACVAFTLGRHSPLPIARLNKFVPGLATMLDVAKYPNVFILGLVCLLAGLGMQAVLDLLGGGRRPVRCWVLFAALALASLGPPALGTWRVASQLFTRDMPPLASGEFCHVAWKPFRGRVDRYRYVPPSNVAATPYFNIRSNRGTITWYGTIVLPEPAIPALVYDEGGRAERDPAYRGMLTLAPEGRGSATDLRITYNSLGFTYASSEPSRALLDFNYDPGWSSNLGTVVEQGGLLGVELPAVSSATQVRLQFRDRRFELGLAIAAAAGVGLVGMILWIRGRRGR